MEHTVRAFEEDLAALKRQVLEMGGLVESQLAGAVDALEKADAAAADAIVARDRVVNDKEHAIDQLVTRILALRQPMGDDLRFCKAALKMANDLERMGDLAANVAKGVTLVGTRARGIARAFHRMTDLVSAMLNDVLQAFAELDAERARKAWRRDDVVDALYVNITRELTDAMRAKPEDASAWIRLLFVVKGIERIGDHVTNLAEHVVYIVEGVLWSDRDADASPHGPKGPP